jgi:hypothetical protein
MVKIESNDVVLRFSEIAITPLPFTEPEPQARYASQRAGRNMALVASPMSNSYSSGHTISFRDVSGQICHVAIEEDAM